jgi:hypothetical protein
MSIDPRGRAFGYWVAVGVAVDKCRNLSRSPRVNMDYINQ